MNKILSMATVVALVTTFSFAQDLGIRAAVSLNSVTTSEGKEIDKKYGIGLGYGGGLVAIFPIIDDIFAVRTGVELGYRTLYNMNIELPGSGSVKQSASEFNISVPAMATLLGGKWLNHKAWFGVGCQLDIPFASKIETDGESADFKNRSVVDFGIIAGLGARFSNIEIDIRGGFKYLVLTKLSSEGKEKNYPASVGITYLF